MTAILCIFAGVLLFVVLLPFLTMVLFLACSGLEIGGVALPRTADEYWVRWKKWSHVPVAIIWTIGFVLDAALNATWGIAVCRDVTVRDVLLTIRMQRYLREEPAGSRRRLLAQRVCRLLDRFTLGGCHCKG